MTDKPRIYVACLAAYNNGHLHGAWIDATEGEWAIETDIQTILASSPIAAAEEWAIHDHEGFEGLEVSEYAGVATVVRLARFVSEHCAKGVAVAEYYGGDLDEAEEALSDRYLGCYASTADYLEEVMGETASVHESLRFYIDWAAMARDAELNGDLLSIEGGDSEVYVFAGG